MRYNLFRRRIHGEERVSNTNMEVKNCTYDYNAVPGIEVLVKAITCT
jgi:hypothetical protein